MTLRVLFAAICLVLFLPIAVFLRPAMAEEQSRVYIIAHCGKPVAVVADHKGKTYKGTILDIENDPQLSQFFTGLLKTASINVIKVETLSGIPCPVAI